jgi:hypothetical protein
MQPTDLDLTCRASWGKQVDAMKDPGKVVRRVQVAAVLHAAGKSVLCVSSQMGQASRCNKGSQIIKGCPGSEVQQRSV